MNMNVAAHGTIPKEVVHDLGVLRFCLGFAWVGCVLCSECDGQMLMWPI
jgi:hypothetical protein